MLDEAHSLGVLAARPAGCPDSRRRPAQLDLIVGTMSKTLASCGGYVCGKKQVIDWFRYTLPGFVYSVGLSPVISTAARTALGLMQRRPGESTNRRETNFSARPRMPPDFQRSPR